MNRETMQQLLDSGSRFGFTLPLVPFTKGNEVERMLTLERVVNDPPDLYPPRALQEMPGYAARQKIVREKPFQVTLWMVETDLRAHKEVHEEESTGFYVEFHLSDLDEADDFLRQFEIGLDDLNKLP